MNTQQPKVLRLAHALSGGKLIDDSTEWADTLHAAAAELRRQHARIAELEAQLSANHPTQQGLDAADTIRLNWLDAQVKNHAVYNGFLWQECGWESDRGLVCAIQGKKQKKTVRQAIDAALAAKAKQGEQP